MIGLLGVPCIKSFRHLSRQSRSPTALRPYLISHYPGLSAAFFCLSLFPRSFFSLLCCPPSVDRLHNRPAARCLFLLATLHSEMRFACDAFCIQWLSTPTQQAPGPPLAWAFAVLSPVCETPCQLITPCCLLVLLSLFPRTCQIIATHGKGEQGHIDAPCSASLQCSI